MGPVTARRRRLLPSVLPAVLAAVLGCSACDATMVSGLNVRAAPTTASAVVDRLASANTMLHIDCFTHGEAVHGQTMWYRISAPRSGYVSAYYVHDDTDRGTSTPAC